MNMQSLLPLLATTLSLCILTAPASAEVKCKCKNLDAVGEGNSSCSVAESGGKCTIDYNQFAPSSYSRARSALSEAGRRRGIDVRTIVVDRPVEASMSLLEFNDERVVAHTVASFMAIPATSLLSNAPRHPNIESDLASLIEFANRNSRLFTEVFRSGSIRDRTTGNENSVAYVVTAGCMELRLPGGLELMFKTPRSPSAAFPRCQVR